MSLDPFLANTSASATQRVVWADGQIVLSVSSYLDDRYPPAELVTSVRGIATLDQQVVMLENRDGKHFLPGGRREPGEAYIDTLRREILEECGLEVAASEYLGFVHLRHESAKPADYDYPYPDFFHLVFAVRAAGRLRSGDIDGYEETAARITLDEARQIPRVDFALPFLDRAFSVPGDVP